MKFVTHNISTKTKPKTLSEIFKAAQTQAALSKTASSKEKEVKVAGAVAPKTSKSVEVEIKIAEEKEHKGKGGASDEAASSGQLDVEPLHQEGESTNQEKVHTDKKESSEVLVSTKAAESPAGKAKKEEGEAESSGQLKVEPLHQKGESTQQKPGDLDTMKTDKEKKEAKGKPKVQKAAFKKIAELTPEEKEFLRGVWRNFWPEKYIDAILTPQ